jgi:2-methylcitrate dehydratase PrpD
VFEGKFGFFETHLTPIRGELRFDLGAAGLGEEWHLPETAFKPYPCCQLLHAFIDAATAIRGELESEGVPLESISRVLCQLAEPGLTLVSEPRSSKTAPTTPHEARFSIYYTTAAALLRGNVGLSTFSLESLQEADVLELAKIVDVAADPNSDYPQHCPARLSVEAAGRAWAKHVPFHPGSPEAALSERDVRAKFERNTQWRLGSKAGAVFDTLMSVSETASIPEFMGHLHAAHAQLRRAS